MLPFSKKRLWTTSETTALLFLFRYIVQCSYQCIYLQQHQQRWMKIDKDWLVISWNRNTTSHGKWMIEIERESRSVGDRENECVLQISSLSTCSQQSTIFHLIPHYSFQFFDCILFCVTVCWLLSSSFNFNGIFAFSF